MGRGMAEPFRVLFPLGVLVTWVAVGHWLAYGTGLIATYSCLLHGVIQMQAFVGAFAAGFLLTALPRRTGSPPASRTLVAAVCVAVIAMTIGGWLEAWLVAESAAIGFNLLLLVFALPRLAGGLGVRRPPAAFVLLPVAALLGIAGACAIVVWSLGGAPVWLGIGRLMVEQGMPLGLVLGAGRLILPLVLGQEPPPDARNGRELVGWVAVAAVLIGSLVIEAAGNERAGELVRALIVAAGTAHAWPRPQKPGAHRRLAHVAVLLLPCGLGLAALSPGYRVPALHVTFMGGIGLLVMTVATHVSLGHLAMTREAAGRPGFVIALGASILLALLSRLAADFSHTYFDHLAWAAGIWIAGGVAWLWALGPALLGGVHPERRAAAS